MSQAEKIRRYAFAHYVEPARAAGNVELVIRAGEVCRSMGLHRRVPNICSALGSQLFLDMAELRLLERSGPRQSTTTTFRYAIAEPGIGAGTAPAAPVRAVEPRRKEVRTLGHSVRGRGGNANLTVVIQCAGTKAACAGQLTMKNGRRVKFVADPRNAPKSAGVSYRHPDDAGHSGMSWRQILVEYNRTPEDNPLNLLPAWRLYEPPACPRIYSDLVEAYGPDNVFILSAGWGLVASGFLLPDYDITFSTDAKSYKRRRKRDHYEDFAMLPMDAVRPIVFLGGKDYVPLFCALTRSAVSRKIVFHYSCDPPRAMNCELRRFESPAPRNWQYLCASALIRGEISAEGP